MIRATEHYPALAWPADAAEDSLTLDFNARHRRRLVLVTGKGEQILLDLPKAVPMADGDGLRLEDGRWLRVNAALEPLLEIRCMDPQQLARIAWHLGNRHLPTEIRNGYLLIRPDHVIAEMVLRLGAIVTSVEAPFQPEGGAYGGGHAHGHDHADGHSHHDH